MSYTKKQITLLDSKTYIDIDDCCEYKTTYSLVRGYNKTAGESFAVLYHYRFYDQVNDPVCDYDEVVFKTEAEARQYFNEKIVKCEQIRN